MLCQETIACLRDIYDQLIVLNTSVAAHSGAPLGLLGIVSLVALLTVLTIIGYSVGLVERIVRGWRSISRSRTTGGGLELGIRTSGPDGQGPSDSLNLLRPEYQQGAQNLAYEDQPLEWPSRPMEDNRQ